MRNYGPRLFFFLLVVAGVITLACGGPSRVPESVAVSPAAADAKDFPGGLVPFTATATYNTMPSPVNGVSATWAACVQTLPPTGGATISSNGVAQCQSGATGTIAIFAAVPIPGFRGICASPGSVPVGTPCGGACGAVVGIAQLTCP